MELTVDITYDGKSDQYRWDGGFTYITEVERHVQEHLSRLIWMKSLKSLVLLKHGPFTNVHNSVHSLLLDRLLFWMFSSDPHPPHSLIRLWIQQFHFPIGLLHSIALIAPSMKAFRVDNLDRLIIHQDFRDVEHISWIELNSLNHLPLLKSAHGWISGEPQEVYYVYYFTI